MPREMLYPIARHVAKEKDVPREPIILVFGKLIHDRDVVVRRRLNVIACVQKQVLLGAD